MCRYFHKKENGVKAKNVKLNKTICIINLQVFQRQHLSRIKDIMLNLQKRLYAAEIVTYFKKIVLHVVVFKTINRSVLT